MAKGGYVTGDRRPIASRERRTWQALARYLAARRINPNAISILGMAFGLLAGLSISATSWAPTDARGLWLAGAVLIQFRLLANMLDGMVAIESGKASRVGELYNEVPDRISDAAILVGVGCAQGGDALLGLAATCAAVFVAYVRAMGKAAGAAHEFCGPMAKPQRMFTMTIVALWFAVAPPTWQPVWGPASRWGVAAAGLWVIIIGGAITAARRLARIASALKGIAP